MTYSLLFHMNLGDSTKLRTGRLVLLKNGLYVDTFIATSGAFGYQKYEDQNKVGLGCIPSTNYINNDEYSVSTTPINLANVKGVAGNFYKINPHMIKTKKGASRGDFGVHFDANAPGSSGCIVLLTGLGWSEFQNWMRRIKDKGVNRIPLVVSYSY